MPLGAFLKGSTRDRAGLPHVVKREARCASGWLVRLGDELIETRFGDEGGLGHTPAVPLNQIRGYGLSFVGVQLLQVVARACLHVEVEGMASIRGEKRGAIPGTFEVMPGAVRGSDSKAEGLEGQRAHEKAA